jgi:hypothetical protein
MMSQDLILTTLENMVTQFLEKRYLLIFLEGDIKDNQYVDY